MHIIEAYFNAGGFDSSLVRGGIAVYIWNLTRHFAALGHSCSIVTAAHGQLEQLGTRYQLEKFGRTLRYTLPLELDPAKWGELGGLHRIQLETEVYQTEVDGIRIYFLSNEYLNRFSDCFYPPYALNGKDLGFNKHIVYQVDLILFLREYLAQQRSILHLHEPFYQFLVPVALRELSTLKVVSTVQSNMPVDKKIYAPTVETLLDFLGAPVDLSDCRDARDQSGSWEALMRAYLPSTHLHYYYDDARYVNLMALVAKWSHGIDFLSEGQRRFYLTFRDTPFRQHFETLGIRRVLEQHARKTFVGGCGVSDRWREEALKPRPDADRTTPIGTMDPALPMFYHCARFAVEHKGQVELVKAIDRHLSTERNANFTLRLINGGSDAKSLVGPLCEKYPENVFFDDQIRTEEELVELARRADFALFPSKFELDTFLIAQGEAMLEGAVPIASAQEGMAHWLHADPGPAATGFAVPRVFEEDSARLTEALASAIAHCVDLFQNRPKEYAALAMRARSRALEFSWELCARRHLEAFERIVEEQDPDPEFLAFALEVGWYDLLEQRALEEDRHALLEHAGSRGDAHLLQSWLSGPECARLAERCWEAGNIEGALALARKAGDGPLEVRIRDRVVREQHSSGLVRIHYSHASARRVQLFTNCSHLNPSGAMRRFGDFAVFEMKPGFSIDLAPEAAEGDLFFLLTLPNGAMRWDRAFRFSEGAAS